MTPTHLTILRTIAAHQPILKEDLYHLLSIPIGKHYYQLKCLHKQGYVQFERKKGPVWLTVRGKEVLDET